MLTSSCITTFVVFYREESVVSYHNDLLITTHSYYIDTNRNLTINFKANLYGKKDNSFYHIKVPLITKRKDTVFYNQGDENMKYKNYYDKYYGFTEQKVKRSSIKNNIDTLNPVIMIENKKTTRFNIEKCTDSVLIGVFRKDKVLFHYLPNDNNYYYAFELNQKVKFDKRILLPITIPFDIATSPLQLLNYVSEKIFK